jgi:hypothetical protein
MGGSENATRVFPPTKIKVPQDSIRTPIRGQRAPRVCVKRTLGAWRALAVGFDHRLDCGNFCSVAKAMALANTEDELGKLEIADS